MICHWRSIHSEVTEVVQSVTNALLCLWKLIQATLTASLERSLFNVPLCYQQFGWWKHLFLNVFLALFCLKFSLFSFSFPFLNHFSLPVLSCRQIVSIRQSAINIPSIEMSTQPKSSDLQGSCRWSTHICTCPGTPSAGTDAQLTVACQKLSLSFILGITCYSCLNVSRFCPVLNE